MRDWDFMLQCENTCGIWKKHVESHLSISLPYISSIILYLSISMYVYICLIYQLYDIFPQYSNSSIFHNFPWWTGTSTAAGIFPVRKAFLMNCSLSSTSAGDSTWEIILRDLLVKFYLNRHSKHPPTQTLSSWGWSMWLKHTCITHIKHCHACNASS